MHFTSLCIIQTRNLLLLVFVLYTVLYSRVYDESLHWSVVNEVLFKCVVEKDLTGVKTYVEAGENVNATNEEVRLHVLSILCMLFTFRDLWHHQLNLIKLLCLLFERCYHFTHAIKAFTQYNLCTFVLHILQGMTALHFAADRGYEEIVEFLLQSGANVNAVDASGQTALMYAASCEHKVSD